MQPFEYMSLNQPKPIPVGAKAPARSDLISRFLADSARYLGLASPLTGDPDKTHRAQVWQSPT